MNNYKCTLFFLEWPLAETTQTFICTLAICTWMENHKKHNSYIIHLHQLHNYICKLISRKSSTRYALRSSQRIVLETPSGKILSTLGGRAFCYAAPKLWNNLPCKISSLDSLSSFKCHLKTYLFKQAFNL